MQNIVTLWIRRAPGLARLLAKAVFALPPLLLPAAPPVDVVIGDSAPALERRAAEMLAGYLRSLYGVRAMVSGSLHQEAPVAFLVGSPATNRKVAEAGAPGFANLGVQGIRVLTLPGGRRMIVGGGSPAATLWAVAELGERLGIRFLLSRDLLPPIRSHFRMPPLDIRKEPTFPIRCWRLVNDFAYGMEGWGINDYRILLEQLAKLRFNRILINIYPWQPFLDLQSQGIRRASAALWYGYRYPITADMIGRGLFGAETEFYNPDIPVNAPYSRMAEAGSRLIQGVISRAKELGMEVALSSTLTDFPEEFAPLLPGAKRIHQLGAMDIVPGPNVVPDSMALGELASSVVKASLDTYPEIDLLAIVMPEHRDWVDQYDGAWEALDRRYGIHEVVSRAGLLDAARSRKGYPGGAERAVQEVKGDLAALHFCDLLFRQRQLLAALLRPDVRLIYSNLAEELYPILQRVLPPGSEITSFIDYTPSRVMKRGAALYQIPRKVPSTLLYTFQDDNIGLLPQLTTTSLAKLAILQRESGWAGFVARNWITAEAEPAALWAARMSWEPSWSPRQAYEDYAQAQCGSRCAPHWNAAFEELERATQVLEWHGLGFAFPIPDMLMKHWVAEAFPKELEPALRSWRSALIHLRRAMQLAPQKRRAAIGWWTARVRFALEYMEAVRHVRLAAAAEAEGDRRGTVRHAALAHALVCRAISTWAAAASGPSDRGAVALLNEYAERPLRAKLQKLGSLQTP